MNRPTIRMVEEARRQAAPGTEPPRERPEAERAGRMLLWSLACGVAAVVVWWAV